MHQQQEEFSGDVLILETLVQWATWQGAIEQFGKSDSVKACYYKSNIQ